MRSFAAPKTSASIALLLTALTAQAEYRFPIGEQATYKIQWGCFSGGTLKIDCNETNVNNQNLIRIRVRVKSNWLVSSIYPVDDTVECFIDPQTRLSTQLIKNTSEGELICEDKLTFDRINNTVQWDSTSADISTNYPIAKGTCDAVSFLYAFRQHHFEKDQERNFHIAVDGALHGINVQAGGTARKKVGEEGRIMCRRYAALPERDDLFVRKIPEEIWITEDERKILAQIIVKIPVGKVRVILDEYSPPNLNL